MRAIYGACPWPDRPGKDRRLDSLGTCQEMKDAQHRGEPFAYSRDDTERAASRGPWNSYWMWVRQYGHTFQCASSGRWQEGQTLRTWVLHTGQTTKSFSIGEPHCGQVPYAES